MRQVSPLCALLAVLACVAAQRAAADPLVIVDFRASMYDYALGEPWNFWNQYGIDVYPDGEAFPLTGFFVASGAAPLMVVNVGNATLVSTAYQQSILPFQSPFFTDWILSGQFTNGLHMVFGLTFGWNAINEYPFPQFFNLYYRARTAFIISPEDPGYIPDEPLPPVTMIAGENWDPSDFYVRAFAVGISEPGTISLFGVGILGLLLVRRRRANSH